MAKNWVWLTLHSTDHLYVTVFFILWTMRVSVILALLENGSFTHLLNSARKMCNPWYVAAILEPQGLPIME
jgi:hypothetical protein